MRLGGERDHVGQLGDRVKVAELGQAGQPERVQTVARQQRQIRVLGPHDAAGGVVQQVALVDRLDEQRVVVLVAFRAVAGGRDRAVRAVDGGRRDGVREQPAVPLDLVGKPVEDRSCDFGERRGRGLDGPRDVLAGVRERGEPGLELRRRRVDAAGEQGAAPGAVGLGVAGRRARRSRWAACWEKKTVSRPVVWTTETGRSPAASRSPSASAAVVAISARYASSSSSSSVARPAATASGLPLSVPGLVDVAGRRDPVPSAPPSRRTPPPAARRRAPCPSPSGPAARRSAPGRRRGRSGSR